MVLDLPSGAAKHEDERAPTTGVISTFVTLSLSGGLLLVPAEIVRAGWLLGFIFGIAGSGGIFMVSNLILVDLLELATAVNGGKVVASFPHCAEIVFQSTLARNLFAVWQSMLIVGACSVNLLIQAVCLATLRESMNHFSMNYILNNASASRDLVTARQWQRLAKNERENYYATHTLGPGLYLETFMLGIIQIGIVQFRRVRFIITLSYIALACVVSFIVLLAIAPCVLSRIDRVKRFQHPGPVYVDDRMAHLAVMEKDVEAYDSGTAHRFALVGDSSFTHVLASIYGVLAVVYFSSEYTLTIPTLYARMKHRHEMRRAVVGSCIFVSVLYTVISFLAMLGAGDLNVLRSHVILRAYMFFQDGKEEPEDSAAALVMLMSLVMLLKSMADFSPQLMPACSNIETTVARGLGMLHHTAPKRDGDIGFHTAGGNVDMEAELLLSGSETLSQISSGDVSGDTSDFSAEAAYAAVRKRQTEVHWCISFTIRSLLVLACVVLCCCTTCRVDTLLAMVLLITAFLYPALFFFPVIGYWKLRRRIQSEQRGSVYGKAANETECTSSKETSDEKSSEKSRSKTPRRNNKTRSRRNTIGIACEGTHALAGSSQASSVDEAGLAGGVRPKIWSLWTRILLLLCGSQVVTFTIAALFRGIKDMSEAWSTVTGDIPDGWHPPLLRSTLTDQDLADLKKYSAYLNRMHGEESVTKNADARRAPVFGGTQKFAAEKRKEKGRETVGEMKAKEEQTVETDDVDG